MVSSALQDRMAAFEKKGPIKNTPMSNRVAAFEKGNVSNANKTYKSSRDLTGIEEKGNKSWANRSQKSNTPSWADKSPANKPRASYTSAASKPPASVASAATSTTPNKKVGFNAPETPKASADNGAANQGKAPGAVSKEKEDKSSSPQAKSASPFFGSGKSKEQKEQEKKEKEQKEQEKKDKKQKEKEQKEQEKKEKKEQEKQKKEEEKKKKEQEKKKKEQEKKEEPVDAKQRKKQIFKCLAIAVLIIACIVVITITIVTGWGDGSTVKEFDKQSEVIGKLVSISQSGFVAVVEDDFGSNQVYRLDPNANPKWQPLGMQFRSQGRVQVSGDGTRLAYVNPRTKRLVFEKYDEVMRDWVDTQDAPFLGGDDISLSGDFSKLCVGSYGQGSITQFNLQVGEGLITTYKYDGVSWLKHGEPLRKIFGLNWFDISPDGTGLLTMADHNGNVTFVGYQSTALGNNTFEWLKADRATTFPSTEADVTVSNGGYAVSTAKSVQAYTYSGRSLGQEISASGNNNITSVALSTDGNTMVVGSVTPGLTGLVDWYRFPPGTTDNWSFFGDPLQDNAAFFGSAVQLNQGSTQIAVQSGSAASGQFGILNKNDGSKLEDNLQDASIGVDGTVDTKYRSLAKELQSAAPISAEDAVHIAILLEEAKIDAETAVLLSQMPKETVEKLKSSSTPMEIVNGLKANLDELKAVEILFSNPERAVVEMEKEGLIDKKRVDFYKKNPSALKDDTNKAIYFAFVSLAAAGGYL